jgi:two-component system cell cycle response regulator DivK
MSVLIVEDEPTLARFYEAALASCGISAHSVLTAEAAEVYARTSAPSIIVTDMNLPGRNGLELVRRLKADPELRGVPVLAVTADDFKWDRRTLMEAGCIDLLVKPVLLHGLLAAVAEHV